MKKVFLTISSCFFIFLFISNFSINSKSYQDDFTNNVVNQTTFEQKNVTCRSNKSFINEKIDIYLKAYNEQKQKEQINVVENVDESETEENVIVEETSLKEDIDEIEYNYEYEENEETFEEETVASDIPEQNDVKLNPDLSYEQGKVCTILNMPSVGIYTEMTYGDSQDDVDNNDVVLDTYKGDFRGTNYLIAIYGHSTRSLSRLHLCNVGDYFTIETANKIYTYRIYIAEPAYISESGCDLISFETGEYLFYYGNGNITMYTCWDIDNPAPSYSGNYRFVVRAEYISEADK